MELHRIQTGTLVALVVLAARPAVAERVLPLDEALALARAHNRDLRVAKARLLQSAASVDQAWVALRPQLSAQGKYTHNYKEVTLDLSQFNQGVLGLADTIKGTSTNAAETAGINAYEQALKTATASQPSPVIQAGEQLDFSATLAVPLIVPAAYPALSAAKLAYRSNGAAFDVTEATVLLSVAQAYFAAAGTDELVTARENAVKVAKETHEDAIARLNAGVVNRAEVMRAEVALVRAEQDEAEARNNRETTYRSLATLLGLHESFRVERSHAAPPVPAPSKDLVESAMRLRPEIAQYRLAIDSNKANGRASAWAWAPTLSAFGNVRAFNYAGFSGNKYSWAVGAQLDWLLYDGGARDAQSRLAAAQRTENEARLDLVQDSLSDEVLNARGMLETKRRALDAAGRSLELSRETLRLVRAQYEAGTAKQLDVLEAQDSLVASEVAVAQARFALALADLQLRRAAGTFPGAVATNSATSNVTK